VTKVEQFIESQGPILSSELANYLTRTLGLDNAIARKRVQRLKSPIHKLNGLFSESQSLVYHASIFRKEIYFEKLREAFEKAGKRNFAIITSIDYHFGVIKKADLANYSFSPINHIKGHQQMSTIIDNLIRANVLLDYDDVHYQLHPYISGTTEPDLRHYKAIEFSKNLVLNQFYNWSRNIGLSSFNKGDFNSEVGGFQFAYTAPTYISGLVQYVKGSPKPGFLVADILIGNKAGISEVDFFVQKTNAIKASNPSIRLFPILITDGVDIDALNKLKKAGVLMATIREVFGENYDELLKTLINTITNAGEVLRTNPDAYINLMLQLTKLVDGQTFNLRGDLFELAVGYYHGQFCKFLEIGKKVKIENDIKGREIDVFANYENKICLVECKGYNYPLDEDYVLRYLNEIVPALRKWFLASSFNNKTLIFEIWSTGGFTNEALELLSKAQEPHL
jgi:hypothetical protein